MRISGEEIDRIYDIFRHLQLVSFYSTQLYNPDEEYRRGIVIAKGMRYDRSADEVYCNASTFNKWHKRIWDKRKKEIGHPSYLEILNDGSGWRIGFKARQ